MEIEILIRLKDGEAGRRKGDIMQVRDIPHQGWGIAETLPNYGKVIINDTTKAEFSIYNKRHLPSVPDGKGGNYPPVRSKYRFDVDLMPGFVQEKQTVLKQNMAVLLKSRQEEDKESLDLIGR